MPPAHKNPKKSNKKPTSTGDKKKKKKRVETFHSYIYKVLKQVHPDIGINAKAMAIMNSLVYGQFERLCNEAGTLARYIKKGTLSSREVQTAVRLILPLELAKHAVSEGRKAVTKYDSNKDLTKEVKKREGMESVTAQAGLTFSVSRFGRYTRKRNKTNRMSAAAPVYLAAVVEYLVAEVVELAGNAARDNKFSRISPRHVTLAVRNDEELNKLLEKVTFPSGGVLPSIHAVLLPKKSKAKASGGPTALGTQRNGGKGGNKNGASSSTAASSTAASSTASSNDNNTEDRNVAPSAATLHVVLLKGSVQNKLRQLKNDGISQIDCQRLCNARDVPMSDGSTKMFEAIGKASADGSGGGLEGLVRFATHAIIRKDGGGKSQLGIALVCIGSNTHTASLKNSTFTTYAGEKKDTSFGLEKIRETFENTSRAIVHELILMCGKGSGKEMLKTVVTDVLKGEKHNEALLFTNAAYEKEAKVHLWESFYKTKLGFEKVPELRVSPDDNEEIPMVVTLKELKRRLGI